MCPNEGFLEIMKRDKDALELKELLSCLHVFVNLLGVDRVHDFEILYSVWRVVILRALLEERAPKLPGISIDERILHGLLHK